VVQVNSWPLKGHLRVTSPPPVCRNPHARTRSWIRPRPPSITKKRTERIQPNLPPLAEVRTSFALGCPYRSNPVSLSKVLGVSPPFDSRPSIFSMQSGLSITPISARALLIRGAGAGPYTSIRPCRYSPVSRVCRRRSGYSSRLPFRFKVDRTIFCHALGATLAPTEITPLRLG